jgi:hypothetical protein
MLNGEVNRRVGRALIKDGGAATGGMNNYTTLGNRRHRRSSVIFSFSFHCFQLKLFLPGLKASSGGIR